MCGHPVRFETGYFAWTPLSKEGSGETVDLPVFLKFACVIRMTSLVLDKGNNLSPESNMQSRQVTQNKKSTLAKF